jgi:hypothetical protein
VPADHITAHKHSIHHRAEILASASCGCFCCLKIFPPSQIANWYDQSQTARCPHCGIDSVIGSGSGYPITADFLIQMEDHWFGILQHPEKMQ